MVSISRGEYLTHHAFLASKQIHVTTNQNLINLAKSIDIEPVTQLNPLFNRVVVYFFYGQNHLRAPERFLFYSKSYDCTSPARCLSWAGKIER